MHCIYYVIFWQLCEQRIFGYIVISSITIGVET
nr:MAG TPA: hypothetical protein [Caudoviricetes sp.]DAW50824.1 MAG TPA: hypothetical protein [Caudoviricetes sp.]